MNVALLTSEEKDSLSDIIDGTLDSMEIDGSCNKEAEGWLTILRKLGKNDSANEWAESFGLPVK